MNLLKGSDGQPTSVRKDLRRLDNRIGKAGLTYRAAAVGDDHAVQQLGYVESELLEECSDLARTIAAQGAERRLMRLLHQRRKLASLLSRGDFELLRRYVSFINSIINSVRETAVDI